MLKQPYQSSSKQKIPPKSSPHDRRPMRRNNGRPLSNQQVQDQEELPMFAKIAIKFLICSISLTFILQFLEVRLPILFWQYGNDKTSTFENIFTSRPGDENFVSCGSAIKLMHQKTGFHLNSQSDASWSGRGSGQQVITLSPEAGNHLSLFLVRESHQKRKKEENVCSAASPIKCNSIVRLTHLLTNKNLHSHNHIKSQMNPKGFEVSAFSPHSNGEGDEGDNWMVMCEPGYKYWGRNVPVRLYHVDSNRFLSAEEKYQFNGRNCGRNCPIMNHMEVSSLGGDSVANSKWVVTYGIHLS